MTDEKKKAAEVTRRKFLRYAAWGTGAGIIGCSSSDSSEKDGLFFDGGGGDVDADTDADTDSDTDT
ncbi:MAG: twin-arginine translocation signal domain-containing protein, partial [Deltaproteobacteria bacterium]|nr:twin-arginine translocation signal domain-containing protein [Deltaproteobacteria bacterium]